MVQADAKGLPWVSWGGGGRSPAAAGGGEGGCAPSTGTAELRRADVLAGVVAVHVR
uniref:Uncharacterized protein n=1 Tax=Oryza sativa subsp. japonica TaxID=39947 RepID=Q7EZJ4_ORYSJ|nr:hypothetical protein [Oryza sativa Japonica Group]